jgi:squalene-hopene/tetraprenyl-beta-curcumene cyclase
VRIDELFTAAPNTVGPPSKAPHQKWSWFLLFRGIDAVLRAFEPLFPPRLRRRAVDAAVAFVTERLNDEDGLGAIFPAMANAVMMFDVLGYARDHPHAATARASLEKLLVIKDSEAYCQPCVSPVWDTALACHALLEAGDERAIAQACRGLDWLGPRQVLDIAGDWVERRPHVPPGGWAFQYANPYYPDLDDTAVIVMAMDRVQQLANNERFREPIERASDWIVGRDGGWAAFDADNTYAYLNNIPFADHGALLDPPTEDVTARCVSMFAQLGKTPEQDAQLAHALDYLRRTQTEQGSWYGRWGMNHIYGTWSVLCALNAAGVDHASPEIRKAVDWLISIQNADGGWGEDLRSYDDPALAGQGESTASQTAWALIGLLSALGPGQRSGAVEAGVQWLVQHQTSDGTWDEPQFTGTGFPGDFYINYHLYRLIFPVMALGRYLGGGT